MKALRPHRSERNKFAPKRLFHSEVQSALYGVSAARIAEITGVHISTARRWKKGEEPPLSALRLIEIMDTGDLGLIDARWTGWKLVNGELVSPDNQQFTPGNVMSGVFYRQLALTYQREQLLPRQGDWLEQKWVTNELEQQKA